TAKLVTVPFLDNLAERKIDLLIVSHADLDHAGGVTTLLASKTIESVVTGEAIPQLPNATRCGVGQTWHFGQMQLRVLHPQPDSAWSGNNASCVLLVQLAEHRLLLTGDIESPVERLLTPALENVDVVIVPHHGSNTSSSLAFVQALRPRLALVSAGFGNRWGLPTPAVVDRWRSVGAEIAITANDGALSQRYCRGLEPGELRRNRVSARRFWTQPLQRGIR
ncbi:MAG: ComEC/Rec2 family competence protein, partial [Woeseiaceae bacterium]